MHPPLAALDEVELLHRFREVGLGAIDFRRDKSAVEQLTGWTDEWVTRPVFHIARHDAADARSGRQLPPHGIVERVDRSEVLFGHGMPRERLAFVTDCENVAIGGRLINRQPLRDSPC